MGVRLSELSYRMIYLLLRFPNNTNGGKRVEQFTPFVMLHVQKKGETREKGNKKQLKQWANVCFREV